MTKKEKAEKRTCPECGETTFEKGSLLVHDESSLSRLFEEPIPLRFEISEYNFIKIHSWACRSCGYVSMRINPDEWYDRELQMVRSAITAEIEDWGSCDGLVVPLKRLKKRLDIPEKLKDMIIKKFIERSKGKFQAPFFEIKSDIVDMKFDKEKDALIFNLPSLESED